MTPTSFIELWEKQKALWAALSDEEKEQRRRNLREEKNLLIECRRCRDGGWVHPRGIDGKPDYTRVVLCSCGQTQAEVDARLQRYSLADMREDDPVDLLDVFKHRAGNEKAWGYALAMGEGDSGCPLWLVIHGTTGNGKTMLTRGIAQRFLRRGKRVRQIYFPTLLSRIWRTMDPEPRETYEDILNELMSVDLLVLDEIGLDHSKGGDAKLEEIVNLAYKEVIEKGRQMCLVATLNVELTGLPAPVLSRFRDKQLCAIIHNTAPDFRPEKKAQRFDLVKWTSGK